MPPGHARLPFLPAADAGDLAMACHVTSGRRRAFTLLELVTVMLVVAILGVMLLPVYQKIIEHMEATKCTANLRGLHVAMALYLQDHHSWPQIKNDGVSPEALATAWIGRLQPYGLDQINWVCPTTQKAMQNPDLSDPDNVRIDYTAMTFDANPQTPYRWGRQPWFVENGNMHGNGNLMVFPDGHVQPLNDFLSGRASPSPGTH